MESRLEIISDWRKREMSGYCLIVAEFLLLMKKFWRYW